MIERNYADPGLRAALGSSPPLEKMKMTDKLLDFCRNCKSDVGFHDCIDLPNGETQAVRPLCYDCLHQINASNLALITDLVDALQVCLGHLTGGLDGDWRDCDPAELAREVLARAKASHGAGT